MEQADGIRRSSRDPEVLRVGLESWLAAHLPPGAEPTVFPLSTTTANGMSSETVLFRADWRVAGAMTSQRLVARLAPATGDVPVFPTYDMQAQFEVIRLVGELTAVPVPKVLWCEPTGDAIGSPFFVMEQVDGEVPPDVMPYPFGDNWLSSASKEDQQRLQDSMVTVLAELHTLSGDDARFAFLAGDQPGRTPLRRHVASRRAWYEYCAAAGERSPLIERGFEWLEEHWPAVEGAPVVSWGDSRIGNAMFRDFQPVAILDWEMAGLGPRELDVGWLVYAHRIFHDMAVSFGMAGMPDFLDREEVVANYVQQTGSPLSDLEFYCTYAAVQYAIVFLRTGQRMVHFGEREKPVEPDEVIYHRAELERMLAGSYWETQAEQR